MENNSHPLSFCSKIPTVNNWATPFLPLLLVILTGSFLGSCSSPAKIDPTIVSTSYDYTKPADIAAQSRPVWVLPIINKGWIPARVDPKTGDWISGHYQATIIQEGYWATQEEAELAGRPYILAGDSSPIIPTPVPDGPRQGGGGGAELNVTALQKRITELEAQQKRLQSTGENPDQLAAVSAQLRGIAQDIPHTQETVSVPTTRAPAYDPRMSVPMMSPPPPAALPEYPSGQAATQGAPTIPTRGDFPQYAIPSHPNQYIPSASGEDSAIILPALPVGTAYDIPQGPHSESPVSVRYLQGNQVEVTVNGKKRLIQLNHPGDKIRITVD